MEKLRMKEKFQVLCYGDSNTWGFIGKWVDSDELPARYSLENRWPGVLQKELGESFHVIEEGLSGRTTIYSPEEEWKNGEYYLKPCLYSHYPLDLVIIMLGSNDLSVKKDMIVENLSNGISRLVEIVQECIGISRSDAPVPILLLAPIEIRPSAPEGRTQVYRKFRGDIGRGLSLMFPEIYKKVAEEKGCYFLNASDYAKPGPADGIHFDVDSHIRLGKAVAEYINKEIV